MGWFLHSVHIPYGGTEHEDVETSARGGRFTLFFLTVEAIVLLNIAAVGAMGYGAAALWMNVACSILLALNWLWTRGDFRRRYRVGTYVMSTALLVLVVAGPAILHGGIRSREALYLVLTPLFPGLLLGRRAALVWTGITVGVAGVVWGLGDILGTRPPADTNALDRVENVVAVVAFVAIFSGLTALQVARQRLVETERARAHAEAVSAELAVAKDELERANQAISRFLANVSHEIRTPLNVVLGMTDVLHRTQLTPEQRRAVDKIIYSGRGLLALINSVLDLSKIEADEMTIERTVFDLPETLEDTTALFAEQATQEGLDLRCEVDEDVPRYVEGDPTRVRQVTSNLLANAIKFTRDGSVTVAACVHDRPTAGPAVVRVEVADTGIGIEPAARERVFRAFEQADDSTARRYGGTGLGLAIAKQLVELMGGTIDYDSEVGVGTRFYFDVPFEVSREAAVRPYEIATEPGRQGRALVADDDADTAEVVASELTTLGFSVTPSASRQMLDHLHESREAGHRYDVVVVDAGTREVAGLDQAEAIRNEPETFGTPAIVLLTPTRRSLDRRDDAARLAGLERTVTLPKPVRAAELTDVLTVAVPSLADAVASASPKPEQERPLAGKRVLVAEDNPDNRELAVTFLTLLGCQPITARDGAEALDRYKSVGYVDAILMDAQMPGVDGLDATRRIRNLEEDRGRHVPIVALTAGAFAADRRACLAAGMDACLTKPYTVEQLQEALLKVL